jgi:hypothetical protein
VIATVSTGRHLPGSTIPLVRGLRERRQLPSSGPARPSTTPPTSGSRPGFGSDVVLGWDGSVVWLGSEGCVGWEVSVGSEV